MKFRLPLFLLLATSACWIASQPAQAKLTFSVIDTTDPVDSIIFSNNNQFVVETGTGQVIAAGNYYQHGAGGILLTIPGYDAVTDPVPNKFFNSAQMTILSPMFASVFTPLEEISNNGDLTGLMSVGGGPAFDATLSADGDSLLIVSNDNTNILSFIQDTAGGILTFGNGSGNGNGNGGGNSPSGTGTGGNPPGGGDGGNSPGVVPEPSTWALLLGSLGGLFLFQHFRFARRPR